MLLALYIVPKLFLAKVQTAAVSWSVAEFIDPWLGDKVNSGIGLSYWPASSCSLTGRYDNLMPELTLSPQSGSMNSATGCAMKQLTIQLDSLAFKAYCLKTRARLSAVCACAIHVEQLNISKWAFGPFCWLNPEPNKAADCLRTRSRD